MNEFEKLYRQADLNKRRFPKGTRVRLGSMDGEPNMPEGLLGTVDFVDDIGQVHVTWENGSSLALNVDVDRFQVVSRPSRDKGMSR